MEYSIATEDCIMNYWSNQLVFITKILVNKNITDDTTRIAIDIHIRELNCSIIYKIIKYYNHNIINWFEILYGDIINVMITTICIY